MFTFSFGSTIAYGSMTSSQETLAEEYFKLALEDVKETGITLQQREKNWDIDDGASGNWNEATDVAEGAYVISYDVLNAHYDDLLAVVKEYDESADGADKVTSSFIGNTGASKTLTQLLNDQSWTAPATNLDADKVFTGTFDHAVVDDLVADQFAADKQDAIDYLNGLSTADFSTNEMTKTFKGYCATGACTTYADHVKHIINDKVSDITNVTVASGSNIKAYSDAKNEIYKNFLNVKEDASQKWEVNGTGKTSSENEWKAAIAKEKNYLDGTDSKYKSLGLYEVNLDYVVNGSVTLNAYTKKTVENDDATSAADIAKIKADIAVAYAKYVSLTAKPNKDRAADVKTMLDYLADKEVAIYANAAQIDSSGSSIDYMGYFNGTKSSGSANSLTEEAAAAAVSNVTTFNAQADQLAAEKDANGALVRDAKDVEDLVKEGTINEYATTLGITATEYRTIERCLAEIKALYTNVDDQKLAYMKKVRETFVEKFLAYHEAEETYYPTELEKVKSLTSEYLTKVNAVTDYTKAASYDRTYFGAALTSVDDDNNWNVTSGLVGAVDKATAVDGLSGVSSLVTVAKDYVDFLNKQISKSDDKYYATDAKLTKEVQKIVGASDARTSKAITALSDEVIAMVKTLPTVKTVEDAADAAEDAYKAVPTTAKTSSKALIDAAIEADKAYKELSAEHSAKYTDLEKSVSQYAYAFNNEMTAKVDAVVTTDKAAVQALIDEIDAFVDTYNGKCNSSATAKTILSANKTELESYLTKIQNKEADAVKAAIAAIPVSANLTEASKAAVENARKLYDAYVAEYTNYEAYDTACIDGNTADGFVANDFEYATLIAAETALDLNKEDPAVAVESLKLKASSTAKKGSITVKWTVTGDATGIDGYEIWKSTKANKGYKKAFTTTKTTYKNTKDLKKGTRYYYKVRAYKMVDGVKVTSDWSNKAYRKAK